MMPQLKVFTRDFMQRLQAAVPANLKRYQEDKSWAVAWAADSTWEFATSCEYAPFKLIEPEKDNLFDLENAIRLHKALSKLTPVQAQDARLWTRLCHVELWDYMRVRWPVERYLANPQRAAGRVIEQYFVAQRQSRALIRNGAARLWWTAKMTYDAGRKNPYELTGVMLGPGGLDIAKNLLERNFGRINGLTKTFLNFLLRNKEDCLSPGEASRKMVRHLSKTLNLRGGICLLDCMSSADMDAFLDAERKKVLAGAVEHEEEEEEEEEE
jgi:hypothetical protein